MTDFVLSLVELTYWLFDKTDNIIVFVPTVVFFFSGCFAILRRLMRFHNV